MESPQMLRWGLWSRLEYCGGVYGVTSDVLPSGLLSYLSYPKSTELFLNKPWRPKGYCLYLWHWPVIEATFAQCPVFVLIWLHRPIPPPQTHEVFGPGLYFTSRIISCGRDNFNRFPCILRNFVMHDVTNNHFLDKLNIG